MSSARRWGLVAAAAIAGCATGALSTEASSASGPPLVGVVASGSTWTLSPLDPRTLAPVPGSWRLRVARGTRIVRSPLGGGVAAVGPVVTRYVDSRTGAALRPPTEGIDGFVDGLDLYWLGGEQPGRRGVDVVGGVMDVSSGPSAGWSYSLYALNRPSTIAPGIGEPLSGADDTPWAAFPSGLVVEDGNALLLIPPAENVPLKRLLEPSNPEPGAALDVAADIAGDRLFVIAAGGRVAEIDHVGGRPHVTYHHVDLNGKPFRSAWAGRGLIVLWGENGVGLIDTRTWKARAIGGYRSVLATPYGIVMWTYDSRPGGLFVHRLDGRPDYGVLTGKVLPSPERTRSLPVTAADRYLYFQATGGHRYTLDLAAGRLVGPARNDVVRLALPSYVSIR